MATLYFCLWFILNVTLVTGQSANYVLKGRDAILTPDLIKPPDKILWKHNGNKVITFDGAEEDVFDPFQGRVTLAWDTAKLTISDVRYEDSGEYELDAISGERLSRSQYLLKVLDQVSKPVIRCEMNDKNSNSNITSATLFCSSPSNTPDALTFVWTLEGKSEPGQTLPIELGNGHDGITYRCTANNHLQEETSTFMATDCYTERTSEPLNIVVPIVIASLILLAFCIFPIIFRHQIKRVFLNMRKNDDCEKQLNATVQKQEESDKIKERDPLLASNIHRQETMLSSQRLPQQEYVIEETQGRVKNICEIFENHGNAETLPGKGHDTGEASSPSSSRGERDLQHKVHNIVPITVEDGDTDSKHSDEDENEDAPPEPQSPSSEPQVTQDVKSTPSEEESSVQTESEKEPDERHRDHDEEEEEETDTNESTKAPEQTEPPSTEPQVHHDIKTTASEQESSVQTDPEKQPDQHHKDKDDEQKTEAAPSSGSIETLSDESTKAAEEELPQPPLQSSKSPDRDEPGSTEQTSPEEENNESMKNPNPTTTAPDHTELAQPPQSSESPDQDEPGSTEQTSADADLETEQVKKDPLSGDPSNNEGGFNSSQMSPVSSEPGSIEPQVHRDIKTAASEQESSVQTDPEEQPDQHHKDKDDEQKKEAAHSSSSTETGPDESTKAPEEIGKGHDTGEASSPSSSRGERDLQHIELNIVPITVEDGDTGSKHSDEDENEDAPPEPQSPSSEPQVTQDVKSTPSEEESSVQTESEKEPDERHRDHDEEEEETDTNESTKAPEQTEPASSEPQVHHDIKTTASEQESSVQTDPEKQPDQHHKDKDDEQKMEASNSTETGPDESTKAPEEIDVSPTNEVQTENNEPLKDSKDVPVSPQTTTAADHPVAESAQPPLPARSVDTVGPGRTDQTKAEGGLDTGPETKAPLSDHPPNNEGRLQSAQMSPGASESQPQSSEPQDNQNIKTTASEQESSEQTESEKQSDEQHKEKDDDQKMEAVHSSNSTETRPEVSPTNEGKTELKEEENELVKESKDVPVSTTTAAHRPESPIGSVSPEETSPDANTNTETENNDPQNDSSNKESSVSQPQSSQPDPAESEEKKTNDGEESNTVGLEKNLQRDSDKGSGTSDDKGTEETSQPQNEPPAGSQRSESSASPEPGMDQTLPSESNGLGDSPRNSSGNNAEKTATAESEQTELPVGSGDTEQTSPDAESHTQTENNDPQNDPSNKESSVSQPQSSQFEPAESEEKIKSKAETQHSETTAPPEPGKAESSGVEAKGHDESNTETQTQDSPHSSSEDNVQGQMSLTSPQTDQPPSQTTDNDKEKKNTGGAEDTKKEKKEESESE